MNLTNNNKNNTNNNLIVSVIVPVLNEKKYVKEFIESVLRQDFDRNLLEILLVDGMSQDGTRDIIKNYCKKYNFIKILDNIKKNIPSALNIGIKNAQGKYIVRMDAHTYYYPDYISSCIKIIKTGNYQNVGGPTVLGYKTRMQKIIAEAHYSLFALGGGKNHNINYEGLADTVQFGTFKKEYLLKMGLYDENIKFAEDDDLNFKIIENNGKIFITPEIKFIYYPRDNLISLFIQYFKYGTWKIAVIKKHKKPARISHLVPICFVIFLVFFPIISIFSKRVYFFTSGVLFLYIFLDLIFSFKKDSLSNFFDKLILFFTHLLFIFRTGLEIYTEFSNFLKKVFQTNKIFKNMNFQSLNLKNYKKKI
ncbi:MAG: glycosyltransferase family 2 protein [Clostridia bacterium]|nr:glycosyltransferase family 2 protein [Clostridia bacterium]